MDSSSLTGFMDVIVVLCGLYLFYGYYLLMVKGELKDGLLTPGKAGQMRCLDLEGYRKYIHLRVLLSAILALINGGMGLYQDFIAPLPGALYMGSIVVLFLCLIWYAIGVHKAATRFFGN